MSGVFETIGFFSYRRGPGTELWFEESQKRIAQYMQHTLGVRDRGFFFDRHSLEPGVNWKNGLRDGLDKSPILLAFFSPGYFESAYCCSELNTFSRRETFLGLEPGSLIHTATIHNSDVFPSWAQEIQTVSLEEYFLLDDSFWNSPKTHDYDVALKKFAEGATRKIRRVIDQQLWYRPDFPKLADVPAQPELNPDFVALLGPQTTVPQPFHDREAA